MTDIQMGAVESRFANIIWKNEPITSTELVKLSSEALNWKRTTTFTVLKRLCNKGIFQNNKGVVTSIISRTKFYSMLSEKYVNDSFNGSLPAFLAAFTAEKQLTKEDVMQLRRLVDEYKEE